MNDGKATTVFATRLEVGSMEERALSYRNLLPKNRPKLLGLLDSSLERQIADTLLENTKRPSTKSILPPDLRPQRFRGTEVTSQTRRERARGATFIQPNRAQRIQAEFNAAHEDFLDDVGEDGLE